MIETTSVYRYAKWCCRAGNHQVGKYIKLQAKVWIRIADGQHKKTYVSEKSVNKIMKILGLMIHPDLLQPMDTALEDYAYFLIIAVFCTRMQKDNRRF